MPPETTMVALVRWAVTATFIYLFVNYLFFFVLAAASGLESAIRRLETRTEDFDIVAHSPFTIPVSVIAPAFNEAPVIVSSIETLLELDYPEHEVIVVNDGSTDETLEHLVRVFDLESRQVFYRRVLPTEAIRAIYRSRKEPRLVVVDKVNGGKADAINVGVNLARYRYICCVDADSFFDGKALLNAMRLVLRDPAQILGLTSQVAISRLPERRHHTPLGKRTMDRGLLTNFQHLDYARSFLNNRLAWSRWDFMLCVVGAFSVWRRDVILELGGFSRDFTCEDIEMTFRVHDTFLRDKHPYRILCLPDVIAVTEGPDRIGNLIAQRGRWQRVINETLWRYRRMLLNPRYRSVGLVGMPYYVLYEGLVPLVELVAVVSFPLAWWLEILSWRIFLLMIGAVSLANAILTALSIWFDDRRDRGYTRRSMMALLCMGLLEYLVYRPVIFVARWKGVLGFLRGDKRWHKFERNRRPRSAAGTSD